MKKYILNEKAFRLKVSQYLREFHNYSGRSLRSIEVFLDNKQIRTTTKLPKIGILTVIEKEKGSNIVPIKMNLDIVYEDDDLLIVNKEPYLLTHPTLKKVDKTLANGIVYHFIEKYNKNLVPRFISRLDMNTSGLIMIAKNSFSQSFIQSGKANVTKKYLALAENMFEKEEIIVEEKIYKDGDELARIIDDRGQYAKTKFKLIKNYPHLDISLIECELFTGRTHQIRVHLKHLGHPIIGDSLYNPDSIFNKIAKRQILHSYKLSFTHPSSGKRIDVEIPIYHDMLDILKI
ncbi:RluA family pseudouridine synthase [Streptobacillus moniliformis]|uniref:RluA family pseudouridine synthase n=1 Tax=Streptobacillus moniliformis TaxID=34105 RepID=UPI0007E36A2B|nr:RluA family pseudouridine synthase [Streptobacillus moniliformis]